MEKQITLVAKNRRKHTLNQQFGGLGLTFKGFSDFVTGERSEELS